MDVSIVLLQQWCENRLLKMCSTDHWGADDPEYNSLIIDLTRKHTSQQLWINSSQGSTMIRGLTLHKRASMEASNPVKLSPTLCFL